MHMLLKLSCRCALTRGRRISSASELERRLITDVVDGDVREEALVGESAEDDHLGLADAHRRVPAARTRSQNNRLVAVRRAGRVGFNKNQDGGRRRGWAQPAGGGGFAPEVGGVGPHPVHLLRLQQLLHPPLPLVSSPPAPPSLRDSFRHRSWTWHRDTREDGFRRQDGSGAERWPAGGEAVAGGGGDRERGRAETPTAQGPKRNDRDPVETRLHYHVTRPICQGHVAARVSIGLPFYYGHSAGGSVKSSVARERGRVGSPSPSLQISARVQFTPADFHFHTTTTTTKRSRDSEG